MQKITGLKIVNYQRNGSGGNGFYTAVFTFDKRQFIATFGTVTDTDDDVRIDTPDCRVIEPADLKGKFDGEDFGRDIQAILNRRLKENQTIYDLIEKL